MWVYNGSKNSLVHATFAYLSVSFCQNRLVVRAALFDFAGNLADSGSEDSLGVADEGVVAAPAVAASYCAAACGEHCGSRALAGGAASAH